MADLPEEVVKRILKENNIDVEDDAIELLAERLKDYIYETSDLASEAAKLDNRSRIKKKDMKDVLKFTHFYRRKWTL